MSKSIPFSPPRIDEKTIEAVTAVLKSGWITTGPKTRELEAKINAYCEVEQTLCLNSWTNAVELALRWFGIGEGDEVIVPAYTYAATANIVIHLGAKPVLIDSNVDNCWVDLNELRKAINVNTKAIMAVDIGGMPMDYDELMRIAAENKGIFQPKNQIQRELGRVLVISDAAHSFGAIYKGKRVGSQTDIMGFSFHAVKNLTTAEGGAITFNLPAPFNNAEIRTSINISALHGQTKDAFSKTQAGQWRYDIVEAGYKCNMTDIHAAIGLVELERYQETLDRRREICERYSMHFAKSEKCILPEWNKEYGSSCFHLYMLRINDFNEQQRDELILKLAEKGISTNVHFQPLPLLSFYRNAGYSISNYPNAYKAYENEISLPVYFGLTNDDIDFIASSLLESVDGIC